MKNKNDKRMMKYLWTMGCLMAIGVVLLVLFLLGLLNLYEDCKSHQIDDSVRMLIFLSISFGIIIYGIHEKYTRLKAIFEEKEIPHKCLICKKIVMVKEIEMLENDNIYCEIHKRVPLDKEI